MRIIDLLPGYCHMIIGTRTNAPIKLQNEELRASIYKPHLVQKIARVRGQLFGNDAEDYFILSCPTFPWDKVPDLVVGRPGIDNFIVAFAKQNSMGNIAT